MTHALTPCHFGANFFCSAAFKISGGATSASSAPARKRKRRLKDRTKSARIQPAVSLLFFLFLWTLGRTCNKVMGATGLARFKECAWHHRISVCYNQQ
jgi:hypothetical protein